MKRPKRLRNEHGLSMIESMASAGILSFALVALTALPIMTIKSMVTARRVHTAATLALDKLEEMENMALSEVSTGSDTISSVVESRIAGANPSFARTWSVASGPVDGMKEVTVRLEWQSPDPRQVELKTLLVR